jgi:hypothetical protein
MDLLEGLNRLLWFWADLGFAPRSSGYRDIVMRIGRGNYFRTFEVALAEPRGRGTLGSRGASSRFAFWFDKEPWERPSAKPALAFPHFSRNVLRSIALFVIERWEKDFRVSVQRHYDWKVSERKRAIEQIEAARERERQRKAAELKALLESRTRLLGEALERSATSREIRSLIEAFDRRVADRSEAVPEFHRWRSWALSEADAMDPTIGPLEQINDWFRAFRLDRESVDRNNE